jgi:hypothetical protein
VNRFLIPALAAAIALGTTAAAEAQSKNQKGSKLGETLAKLRQKQAEKRIAEEKAAAKKFTPYSADKTRKTLKQIPPSSLGSPINADKLNAVLAADLVQLGETSDGTPIPDDQFIRRVYLDLIGQLPSPADVKDFLAEASPNKREKLVDQLLALPQFGENWARYWHDAISYRNTAGKNREVSFDFQPWMAEQFNKNVGWDKTVSAIITANGKSEDAPQGLLLAAHDMMPAEIAGETARLFMGLQISCAQCHDHPNDHWKRTQFHELTAFFGKVAVRRNPADMFRSAEIQEKRFGGEYRMPNLENPSEPGTVTMPIFLTGQPAPNRAGDLERRRALAEMITTPKNPLFAKAFVNRVWASLVGSPFTDAVDDIGEHVQPSLPKTFDALAKSFAASKYDVKRLMKTIALSDAYQRQYGASREESEPKASASAPTRLASTQIFDALTWAVGDLGPPRPKFSLGQRGGRNQNVSQMIETVFGFDPSSDAGEIEGSIPQALLLMNNPQIHARINAARSDAILAKILKNHPSDDDAIRALYLRTLARTPTEAELGRCRSFLAEVNSRGEAFEDILWALINTVEFLHNH